MKKFFVGFLTLALLGAPVPLAAQTGGQPPAGQQQQQPATPQQQQPPRAPAPRPAPRPATLDLSDYGVSFGVEPRLVVVMSALDAAGFDPAPGKPPSLFRARLRQEQAGLDANLRERLRRFYDLNRLRDPAATPARDAARFVSLAFALGPPPSFEAPARGDESLFEGVLDVLDFAPLVAEYFRKSGIEERLPTYLAEYRAEGDRMRRQTADMVRSVLNYLHTRPATTVLERVAARAPAAAADKKKPDARPAFETRERDRRFVVIPDLLAVPGAINSRVVGDDYFVVVPAGTDLSASEVRRAYLQYVVDPLVLRYNRDIALKRAEIRALLDERLRNSPGAAGPDVFQAFARSIVVAADARMTALARTEALSAEARARLARLTTPAERDALTKEVQARRTLIEDETTAELAEAYERGAVLAFYFAERLREQESAGFDFADSIPDLVARIDQARELRRPAEYAEARARALAARESARKEAARAAASAGRDDGRRAQLIRQLDEVGRMLGARNYPEAETRLIALMGEYQREPRIFYALGQTFSVGASDATNEAVRDDRLRKALANYRFAIDAADRELDRALLSRAYVSAGRILAFLEERDEALKMFDAAVQLGEVPDGSYRDALDERKKLQP
jgi:hypothetical protein